MTKNNNKLVLVAFLLAPLFTAGIAVGGMPNAYAGDTVLSVSMNCVADPPNTEIDFTYVISNPSPVFFQLVNWQITGDFSDMGSQPLPPGGVITDSFSVPGFSATASITVLGIDEQGNRGSKGFGSQYHQTSRRNRGHAFSAQHCEVDGKQSSSDASS